MQKIISVGNISLGGTGKTPFVIYLANRLTSLNYKVAVLSRGYKGKSGYKTTLISDGKKIYHTPPIAADEPYMIALNCKNCIVITGKERKKSIEFANKNFEIDIFILDDGFQHKKLNRDIDIVLLDYNNPISTGLPFPFGYLREFPSSLRRADIIVFTKTAKAEIPNKVKKYITSQPVFFVNFSPKYLIYKDSKMEINYLKNKKLVAFSAIAKNRSFFNLIESLGGKIVYKKGYLDHHHYSEKDINFLIKIKKRYDADFLITTEKDFVKLPEFAKQDVAFLKIETAFLKDEDKFLNIIKEKISPEKSQDLN